MSELNLERTLARAAQRLGDGSRKRRSDAGGSRLDPAVEQRLMELLSGSKRPNMSDVQRKLAEYCRRRGVPAPSRGTLYNALARVEPPWFDVAELPLPVQKTLHNVGPRAPGHQIVFSAFNTGDTRALSYASSMPWACLARAEKLRGWRPKSRALLRAVLACRGI